MVLVSRVLVSTKFSGQEEVIKTFELLVGHRYFGELEKGTSLKVTH